ncbi:protein FAR1-RELATED SEQUENCE 7-like isoform X3 [Abrus precatorius]|uniref:Protein FAR1-RELATED SEQUENCE n=1 Tax=Abrus precatorius TaxID=3816 RepID=A0A8B8M7K9_ABRPR|nr:protein FAR1-RELATED SEQUENCE 7-like isoform X3 [Abrus precatorius]
MDGDRDELGTVHEENVEIGSQTSNELDLNVEQNCCSPNISHADDSHSAPPSVNVLNTNRVLGIGTEFESDDHAYRFYNNYAKLVGFNVRKDWINRSKVHGQVVSRKFTCSKEGYRRKDKRDVNVKKHRKETRTGCLAHMIITRQPDGKYQVTHFEAQHNHDNINHNNANMINLQNEFSVAQAVEADSNNNLGPKSKSALDMLNKKISARESLDQLSMNYDNYFHSERERDMSEGEAGRLLGYFQRQHFENPAFFYAIQLDVDDKLYEKTLKHLSHVVKDAESFGNDLRSSIYDPKDEEEFTNAWKAMLEKYSLQQNEWLRWMYREREKWAVIFGRNSFFVDIKGFHLGEILSDKFRSYLNSDLDVVHFFKHFERVVDEQRYKEIKASDEMSRRLPRLMGNVILLKHASNIYTPRAFEVFQRGYEKSLNVLVYQHCRNGSLFEYKTNTFGRTRQYCVTFNSSDDTVVCSCLKFEHVGFLCSHALKVLDHKNIKVVPSQYILKRWTKDARLGNQREIGQCKIQDNPSPKMIVASCYKDLCHRLLKLSARASESIEAYQFASRRLDEVMEGVEKILTVKVEQGQVITSSSVDANASESEPAEIFLNGHAIEDRDESNKVNGEKDRRATSNRGHLTTTTCNGTDSDRILNVETSSPNTVVCISSPSSAYVSSQSATPNPILQGLYSFEANQVVHCLYEQPSFVLDHQSNTNMFQPSNFLSNQQESQDQSQLLQEPIIQNTYHESMPSSNQGMDLDIQNPHPSSFLLYDHRYRSSDST